MKCKKDFFIKDILIFQENENYEQLSDGEFTVMIQSSMGKIQFRKMEETKIGINDFSRLSFLNDYFYTVHELRKIKIEKIIKNENS